MKTKAAKVFLILSIVLSIAVVVLTVVLIFFNPNKVVPNKDKFELDKEPYEMIPEKWVGDGLFCVDRSFHTSLRIHHPSDDEAIPDIILDYVHEYEFENENLYCYSEDGYAVVYAESNLCKVFITPPQDLTIDGITYRVTDDYSIDKISPDEYPENKNVIYLDSFDEFTPYEQKMLRSLVRKKEKTDEGVDVINSALGL